MSDASADEFLLRNKSVVAKAEPSKPSGEITHGLFVGSKIAEYFQERHGIQSDPVADDMNGRDHSHFKYELRIEGKEGLLNKLGRDALLQLIDEITQTVPQKREKPVYFVTEVAKPKKLVPVITGRRTGYTKHHGDKSDLITH